MVSLLSILTTYNQTCLLFSNPKSKGYNQHFLRTCKRLLLILLHDCHAAEMPHRYVYMIINNE